MPCRLMTAFLAVQILSLGLAASAISAPPTVSPLWSEVSAQAIAPAGERLISPDRYRALELDLVALRSVLARVPLEGTPAAAAPVSLALPLPEGGFGRFAIVESPILAPELGARYPEIRTYAGRGLDDPSATVRLDLTPAGFHAHIIAAGGSIYIDPFQRGDIVHYQSYAKRDLDPEGRIVEGCQLFDEDGMAATVAALVGSGEASSGTQLRTYRAAVAATGEYTIFHGGTVPLGLAAVTTAMNRVTGVYEREVSVRMQLVPNNDLIIYTNPNTDPYTNSDGVLMLSQNQANLDAVIGSANYDIGHVFSTGGGGVASLAVVCRAGVKARGVTGLPSPIGDPFYIDYVAHEIGHQYGGNHNFNGNAGACAGGRNASTAYEPGSGSTIMAYAGICSSQNLQFNSDDYFHWISIQEIVNYSTFGSGNTCPVTTPTGAVEPVVSAGTGNFTIPIRTPFALTASATTTGAATYCWEESDLGPAGHPNSPSGNAPIFRSFRAVTSPTRTFPKLSDLLNNTQTLGEILPTYTRGLSFKVVVRDVQAGGVGVSNASLAFSVSAVAGPFLVTYPNTVLTWYGGTQQTVTWDVAGTDISPVNCASVNIWLSTNGGSSFPIALAMGTPNDGSETIVVPNEQTNLARVKVEAADNVFFDISNVNFQIQSAAAVAGAPGAPAGLALHANRPNPFNPATAIAFDVPAAGPVTLRVSDLAGRHVRTLVDGEVPAGRQEVVWDGTDGGGRAVGSGVYLYELRAAGETLTGRMVLIK